MKRVFLCFTTLVIMLQYSTAYCQPNGDSIRYAKAYSYILNDSIAKGESFMLLDSIVDMSRYQWAKLLSHYPDEQKILENEKATYDYRAYKQPIYSSLLSSLDPSHNYGSDWIVLFSYISDNMLIAESVKRKRNWETNIPDYNLQVRNIRLFTVSNEYLFLFGENNEIKGVFRSQTHYN